MITWPIRLAPADFVLVALLVRAGYYFPWRLVVLWGGLKAESIQSKN